MAADLSLGRWKRSLKFIYNCETPEYIYWLSGHRVEMLALSSRCLQSVAMPDNSLCRHRHGADGLGFVIDSEVTILCFL